MRVRRFLAAAVAVTVTGALAVLLWPSRPGRCPLELNLVGLEPAGIFDNADAEMWLVTTFPPALEYKSVREKGRDKKEEFFSPVTMGAGLKQSELLGLVLAGGPGTRGAR